MMASSQAWVDSILLAMLANFSRMTGWSRRRTPNVLRFEAYSAKQLVSTNPRKGELRRTESLLVADTSEAVGLNGDTDTLRVKVGHDELESLVLLPENVLNRDEDLSSAHQYPNITQRRWGDSHLQTSRSSYPTPRLPGSSSASP